MIPFLDRKESAEVDRLMIERYGIDVPKMMEYAGYHVANFVRNFNVKRVLIVCGKGNNGGDGLCAARHLDSRGYDVHVFVVEPKEMSGEAKNQLKILERIGVEYFSDGEQLDNEVERVELIIDGLLGYNLEGNPRAPYDAIIQQINRAKIPVVAVDVPSGWDCASGRAMQPCIKATHVLCLSFPKKGMDRYNGEIYLADMGLPKILRKNPGLEFINVFKDENIVKL